MTQLSKEEALIILGFSDDAEPTLEEIKAAYKKMALQTHPDRNRDKDTTEDFKKVGEAYAVLSTPTKKKGDIFQSQNPFDIFSAFFGADFFNMEKKASSNNALYKLSCKCSSLQFSSTRLSFYDCNDGYSFNTQEEFLKIIEILPKKLYATQITISITPELPYHFTQGLEPSIFETIMSEFKKSTKLIEVNYPEWFFSPEQRAELAEHLKSNISSKEQKEAKEKAFKESIGRKKNYAMYSGIALGAVLGFFITSSQGIFTILYTSLLSGYIGKLFTNIIYSMRQNYFNSASSYFNSVEKIETITDPIVKEKLNIGVEAAESWPNWLCSFGYKKAYDYQTFGGAYQLAMQGDEEVVSAIKKLKIS